MAHPRHLASFILLLSSAAASSSLSNSTNVGHDMIVWSTCLFPSATTIVGVVFLPLVLCIAKFRGYCCWLYIKRKAAGNDIEMPAFKIVQEIEMAGEQVSVNPHEEDVGEIEMSGEQVSVSPHEEDVGEIEMAGEQVSVSPHEEDVGEIEMVGEQISEKEKLIVLNFEANQTGLNRDQVKEFQAFIDHSSARISFSEDFKWKFLVFPYAYKRLSFSCVSGYAYVNVSSYEDEMICKLF
ncbi:hypothetical protein L1987_54101 [Smallanthus sonchifolius]|uniref:Uncharacterized protein n=1 Tax=Smallanthus sonchifolius TaxID=185202 RepID=A0ACB9E5V4_9ASTR|nr:hypothetical protein L1987_54101 [Smallanthus sonchifolius]